jgi:hypothetical protein
MATTESSRNTVPESLFAQLDQLREQAVNTARESGTKYLDAYAKLARELTDAYISASRALLK